MAEVPVNTTADEAPKITDVEAGYPSLAPTPEPKVLLRLLLIHVIDRW